MAEAQLKTRASWLLDDVCPRVAENENLTVSGSRIDDPCVAAMTVMTNECPSLDTLSSLRLRSISYAKCIYRLDFMLRKLEPVTARY